MPLAHLTVPINCSNPGDNVVIAAPTDGRRIAVYEMLAVAAGPVNATFKSDTFALSGPLALPANGSGLRDGHPDNQRPIYVCAPNQALVVVLSAAVQVGGRVSYELV